MPMIKHCAVCGSEIKVPIGRVKDKNYCSVACANADKFHRQRRTDVTDAGIIRMYLEYDMSGDKIAAHFNCSKSTICRRLRKLGLTKPAHGHEGRNGKRGTVFINGYPAVYAPTHHRAKSNGYVREHILVVERMLGRHLAKGEVVHHINEDKTDNRPVNLMVFPNNMAHMRHHWELRAVENC
jgi:predicted nucleic acid-binding Zn ribbon protein